MYSNNHKCAAPSKHTSVILAVIWGNCVKNCCCQVQTQGSKYEKNKSALSPFGLELKKKFPSVISSCQNDTLPQDSYKLPVHEQRLLLTTEIFPSWGLFTPSVNYTTTPWFFLLIYRLIIKVLRWATFLIFNIYV